MPTQLGLCCKGVGMTTVPLGTCALRCIVVGIEGFWRRLAPIAVLGSNCGKEDMLVPAGQFVEAGCTEC